MPQTVEVLKLELSLLTERERAELARFLIHSLDTDVEEGVEIAWEAELTRRVAEIRSGQAVGKPADLVFAELRDRFP